MTNPLIEEVIKLRESGKLYESIKKVDEVLAFCEKEKNTKGIIEALGHKRLALNHIGGLNALKDALEVAGNAIALAEKEFSGDKNLRALLNMHLADALISYSEFSNDQNKLDVLRNAFDLVDKSVDNLGGSKAHKSWGLNKKAQIQYLLGDVKGAQLVLKEAEHSIYDGYKDEIKEPDGEMKIKTWLTGIWLTYANIYKKEGRDILFKLYANAVKNMPDPENTLVLRKKQAEEILTG